MNVMDGMRGNQEMIVSGESNVDETATAPLDYVVSGSAVADRHSEVVPSIELRLFLQTLVARLLL